MTKDGRTIRYGLIGCGMMGQEHIRNIALLDGVTISGFVEPDMTMAGATQALLPSARRCGDLDALLQMPDIDALVIASPNDLHADQLLQILTTQPKPVLIEKPLCTDRAQMQRLRCLPAQTGAPVWVAMEYRYMPPIAALVAQAQAATGGVRMLTIREHRFPFLPKVGDWNRFNNRTGGTLVEKCCHFFDLMRLILQAEPVRVMASGGQDVNHLDEAPGGFVPDVWDNAYVMVDFDTGARAMLELCMFAEGSQYQEEITAVGPAGKIEAKVPGPERFWPRDLGLPPEPHVIVSPRDPRGPTVQATPVDPALLAAGDHNGSTFYQHQRFLDLVRQGGTPEVTLHDGLAAVDLGLAATEAALSHATVDLRSDNLFAQRA